MGRLLAGTAPLRGRAGLELLIPPFDHRLAGQFWEITDLWLAIKVNAVVVGTPAYRREFSRNDSPAGPDDFDSWAGAAWHSKDLVFCHVDGTMYTSDALNWRFSKMTKKAGIGHWHAHESPRHLQTPAST
jgi:hypothetical protein